MSCVGVYRSYLYCLYVYSVYIQYLQLNKVKAYMLRTQYLIEVSGKTVEQKYRGVDIFVLIREEVCALTLEAVKIN